jgi:putative transposase
VERVAELIEPQHPTLSMRTQCKLLGIARSSVSYQPVQKDPENTRVKRLLDELYLQDPCLGTRRLVTVLEREHSMVINRKRIQRLRQEMGMEAIYCKPRTTIVDKAHQTYPYLLRKRAITKADQVWCADITYVPMGKGSAYLCAVMDYPSFLRLRSQASQKGCRSSRQGGGIHAAS